MVVLGFSRGISVLFIKLTLPSDPYIFGSAGCDEFVHQGEVDRVGM